MDTLYDDFVSVSQYKQEQTTDVIQKYITENNINKLDAWKLFLSKLTEWNVTIYDHKVIVSIQAIFEISWPEFIPQIYKFIPYYNLTNLLQYDNNNNVFDALFSIKLISTHKQELLFYVIKHSRWDLLQKIIKWTSFSLTKTLLQRLWKKLLKTAPNRQDIWVTVNKVTSLYSRIGAPIVDLMIQKKNYMALYMYINGCIQNKILDPKRSKKFAKMIMKTNDPCFLDGLQLGVHAFIWIMQAVSCRWYEGYINILINANIDLNTYDDQTIYALLNKAQSNKILFEDISRRCPNAYYKWLQ